MTSCWTRGAACRGAGAKAPSESGCWRIPGPESADDPSLTKKARAVPDSLTDLTGNEEGTSGTSAEASSGEFEGGD